MDEVEYIRPSRDQKGKSIVGLPSKYCVIDIETTGLSPQFDSIIEVAAIKYEDGRELSRFSSLLKPEWKCFNFKTETWFYIDEFIEDLTGITNEMLETAPEAKDALAPFYDFIGDDLLLGYNVNFDVNFLYDKSLSFFSRPLTNDFIDIMRIARKLYPDMEHHRLFDMTELLQIQNESAHRAESDCLATNALYDKLKEKALDEQKTEEAFVALFKRPPRADLSANDIVGNNEKNDQDSPLYGKYCVFTGKLDRMTRKEAMQIVADIGGINEDRVTKKTNYLILGNNDYCSSIKEGKSTKHKKAEKLQLQGQDISIIPEDVFYDMIEG